jgi:rSAM/selenodomain-associated transferase 1
MSSNTENQQYLKGDALVIFAKAPVVGQVKTRLCPPLSATEATELARCFLFDVIARAVTLSAARVYVAFTPPESEHIFRALLPFPIEYVPQRGDSLGEREVNIFIDLLQRENSCVVLIGSDIPTLPIEHIQEAFMLLKDSRCDAVLGPSSDGGYYLVGARAAHRALFENITWSTASVLAETLAQAHRHGLSVSLLPSWYDVDEQEDLRRLVSDLEKPAESNRALRTREFLTQLKINGVNF